MAKPATKPKVESSPAKPTASTKPPALATTASSADQLKSFYRDMLLIRRFEERAGQLYGMGLIGGFCHLYIGQEAVVVGMQSTIKRQGRDHHLLPRPRPHAGQPHGPQGRDGRADRPGQRLFQGQGRLHAHVQPREELLWRPRHRRRPGADRHGLAFAHKYNGSDNSAVACLPISGHGSDRHSLLGGGIPIDALVADFISGGAEWVSPARDDGGWDLIEGQGSPFHPSFAGVPLGLLHGAQPDALVLCHEPGAFPHARVAALFVAGPEGLPRSESSGGASRLNRA